MTAVEGQSPGAHAERARRRVILDTRTKVRQLQLQVAFSAPWQDQLETIIKPVVRVAMAEETSALGGLQPPWIPAAAPSRVRPVASDQLYASGSSQGNVVGGSSASDVASSVGGPTFVGDFHPNPGQPPVAARRPSLSNVSGTTQTTMGVVSDASTVWERGDIVSRVVIEEGKSATVLRNYTNFVQFLCANGLPVHGVPVSAGISGEMVHWPYETAHFLVNAGFMLRSVLQTVEAAQTVDAHEFLQHVTLVLLPYRPASASVAGTPAAIASALGSSFPPANPLPNDIVDILQTQAIVLSNVFLTFLDRLGAAETLMDQAVEDLLVPSLLAYGERQLALAASATDGAISSTFTVDPQVRHSFLRLFVTLLSAESFQMRRDRFFSSKAIKDQFARVLDGVVKLHFGTVLSPEIKKELRPVLDVILRYK